MSVLVVVLALLTLLPEINISFNMNLKRKQKYIKAKKTGDKLKKSIPDNLLLILLMLFLVISPTLSIEANNDLNQFAQNLLQ